MNKLQLLEQEMEATREQFLALLASIPESAYSLPTDNSAWTIGDILYHLTLGPKALILEIWMILHARGLFQFALNHFPSKTFNRLNARFSRRSNNVTRAKLIELYEAAHTNVLATLRKTREEDLSKSVVYPAELEAMLAGETSVEKLFHYVKNHFEAHRASIRRKP
jgi:hypothetical protein